MQNRYAILTWSAMALMAIRGAAGQTVVTKQRHYSHSRERFPYVSAATGTSTTLSPSPISVSGSNKVGIGTSTPGQLLEVNGYAQVDGTLQVGNGTGPVSLLLQDVSGSTWSMTTTNSVLNFKGSSGNSLFLPYATPTRVVTARVGIGTSNPQAGLDIEQSSDPNSGGATMGLRVNNTINYGESTDYPQNLSADFIYRHQCCPSGFIRPCE